ncbi:Hypothetical predicted protein [Olea europaea subsp. europaea]|uniref:Pentatricopeptide repeat-containing protein n=1 Tax=Olea europaea subsp. europaea TaxID=158383 RepID=A0A8S0PDX1_OLEEU|nr:Hypothetical predicted protein [Olea europaea subsp. europaea]
MRRVALPQSFTTQIDSTTRFPIESPLATPTVLVKCLTLLGKCCRTIVCNGCCDVVLGGIWNTALEDFHSKMGHMDIACGRSMELKERTLFLKLNRGDLAMAQSVFDEMPEKEIITLAIAQSVFDERPEKDVISWNVMVSSYTMGRNMEQGYALFRQMLGSSFASWNAMICGYLDCRKIELACSFFDAVPQKNNVSHITVIFEYSKCCPSLVNCSVNMQTVGYVMI